MAKILVVTKDIAEFLVYRPVVEALQQRGHCVFVVNEGLSCAKWLEKTHREMASIHIGSPKGGDLFDDSFNPREFLSAEKQDLVLTGLGSPINLGEKFGLAANELGIPLGYVEDTWGVHKRSKAIPQFICTLDPFGKSLIGSHEAYGGRTVNVYVTGSPAWDDLRSVAHDQTHLPRDRFRWFNRIVLLICQNEATTPVVKGLVEALNKSGEKYLLIPRFHPKFTERAVMDKWRRELSKAEGQVTAFDSVNPRHLMLVAHDTVSVYSNALVEAAHLGSFPISWVSDIGRELMEKDIGLRRFPLVESGCGVEVDSSEGWSELVPLSHHGNPDRRRFMDRCREVYPCDGGNTNRVIEAIKAELKL